MITGQTFASVWDALCDTPEEAELMKIKSELMIELRKHTGRSPDAAAKALGITRGRAAELLRGDIDGFTVEELTAMTANVKPD